MPFTLHSLVELIHNSTNAKEQKNRTSQCLQKRGSKLISSLPEHKKVEDFLFLPLRKFLPFLLAVMELTQRCDGNKFEFKGEQKFFSFVFFNKFS